LLFCREGEGRVSKCNKENGETKRKPGGRGERTEDVRDQGEGYYKEVFWSTLESLYMLENLMMNPLFLLNPVII